MKNLHSKANKSGDSKKEDEENKPRNHLITDASSPYTFSYMQYGQRKSITVNQTPEEETWPGGALWDVGVLLANVLVMVNTPVPLASDRALNVDRLRKPGIWPKSIKDCKVLELGCGVGLTGLVAASLGAKLTLLTDLNVVVERVTEQNVVLNKKAFGIGQAVFAVPLCWGSREDENICRNILGEYASKNTAVRKGKKSKKKNLSKSTQGVASTESMLAVPDIILIGDVAYQHKPGAPSHFDILIETLLNFASNRDTLVIFGTRMRMPASSDLLDMFYEHFDEVVKPPVEASELDNGFHEKNLGKNSMITLHFFKRKQAGH